ncbi:MAG: helix-turn-helix transcriptional regulator [Alkaliphilus sp.]
MNITKCTATRIIQLCKENNITINRLALISCLTQSTVDSIVKGKSKNPSVKTIKKICQGFEISMSDFFDDSFDSFYES